MVLCLSTDNPIQVNVFKLGQTFKDFCKECDVHGFEPVLAENLVYRFATKLEFGRLTEQVAQDAVRLVQRMDRDWLTTGRRPAGICGACLILAARMNNFRRTVREVVYIAKVTDVTITKRLDEFQKTESSTLTVEQFRIINLEKATDPPSFYKQAHERKKRRRILEDDEDDVDERENEETTGETAGENGDTTADNGGEVVDLTQTIPEIQTETPQPTQDNATEFRRDSEGFLIPNRPTPIDPALLAASADALSQIGESIITPPATAPTEAESDPSTSASTSVPISSRSHIH